MCELDDTLPALCPEHSSAQRIEAVLNGMGIYMGIYMSICMGTVWFRGVEFRVLGRCGVRGGVVKMQVYTRL